MGDTNLCSGCGGPYLFDTSIPSVLWNRVIRSKGLPEYLCASCILREFAFARVSFTATLSGADFSLLPIEVRILNQSPTDLIEVNAENNRLRVALREAENRLCAPITTD